MRSRIEAIGAYLPDREVTTAELMGRLAIDSPPDLERITGVRTRRVRGTDADGRPEDSYSITLAAARSALAASAYSATDLDVVITCSITRTRGTKFQLEPSFALTVRNALGAHRALHFDVANACAGMMTGILVLDRMIRSGAVRRGLVVSGECITPIADTAVAEISEKYDLQFASLSVGDAGAAVVLDDSGVDGDCVDYIELNTSAAFAEACIGMPSDQRPDLALYTDNRALHTEGRYLLGVYQFQDFLAARGSSFPAENYDYVVHHQFSAPAVELIDKIAERELGAPMPPGLAVLEKYGNTASTAHFVVLHDALRAGTIAPGSKVWMVPAASGVVTGFLSVTVGATRVGA
ncbi:3-oxoacyl-ACP synthase III family protein [Nocardia stercoris]|nr:3-oxoacyl-[acyl-carrier-protein] synthase III C-terminal domain-containing protein [Nocardia stercoris]